MGAGGEAVLLGRTMLVAVGAAKWTVQPLGSSALSPSCMCFTLNASLSPPSPLPSTSPRPRAHASSGCGHTDDGARWSAEKKSEKPGAATAGFESDLMRGRMRLRPTNSATNTPFHQHCSSQTHSTVLCTHVVGRSCRPCCAELVSAGRTLVA